MFYGIIIYFFNVLGLWNINNNNKIIYTYTHEPIVVEAKPILKHTSEDVWITAKCVCSEALNQSDLGQQYVAEVIINRVRHKKISFKEVIYAKGQFDGVRNKYFKRKPTPSCVLNTVRAFYNPELPLNTMYFANETISTDRKWIRYLQKYKIVTEQDHSFYIKD